MLLGNYLYSSLALEAGSEHDVDFHCTDMPSMSFCSVWGYASTYLVSFIRETLLNVTSFQIPVYVPGEGGAVSQKCEAKDGGGFRSPLLHSPPLPWGPEVPGLFASSTGSHTDQQVSPPLTRGQASCSLFSPCFPVARMQLLPSLPFSLSSSDYDFYKNSYSRTSLVVQWLRTCLAVQGRWVQSLAGKLRCHSLQGN